MGIRNDSVLRYPETHGGMLGEYAQRYGCMEIDKQYWSLFGLAHVFEQKFENEKERNQTCPCRRGGTKVN